MDCPGDLFMEGYFVIHSSSKNGLCCSSIVGSLFHNAIIIQKWIVLVIYLWKVILRYNNHPKMDCTDHPFMEGYFVIHSSSKNGLCCSSIVGSLFHNAIIIQKSIVLVIYLWKVILRYNNHPKMDCNDHSFMEGYFVIH